MGGRGLGECQTGGQAKCEIKYRLGGDDGCTKYEITLHWSNEDQALVAEPLGLPGCVAQASKRRRRA